MKFRIRNLIPLIKKTVSNLGVISEKSIPVIPDFMFKNFIISKYAE